MELWAFKHPMRTEKMSDHILDGIKFIKKYYISIGYHERLLKKINKLSKKLHINLSLTPDDLVWMITVAYSFHDIGKIASPLYERILTGRGAPLHELFSSAILSITMNLHLTLKNQEKTLIIDSIYFAILLHHSAMRQLEDFKHIFKEIYGDAYYIYLPHNRALIFNQIIEKVSSIVNLSRTIPYVRKMKIPVANIFREYENKIAYWFGGYTPNKLLRYILETLVLSILHPLIMADNYAASIHSQNKIFPSWLEEYINSMNILV